MKFHLLCIAILTAAIMITSGCTTSEAPAQGEVKYETFNEEFFSVDYPAEGWNVDGSGDVWMFLQMVPADNPDYEIFVYATEQSFEGWLTPADDFDEFSKAWMEGKSDMTGIEMISMVKGSLSGIPAIVENYYEDVEGETKQTISFTTFDNGRMYGVIYTAPPESFDKYQDIAMHVADSFVIKS